MSFDLKTKDASLCNKEAFNCLSNWQVLLMDNKGAMQLGQDGRFVTITVNTNTRKDHRQIKSISTKLTELKVHHTYKYFHEICSSGSPEMSKHYNVEISGRNADGDAVKFSIYLNKDCEDGKTWSSWLTISG